MNTDDAEHQPEPLEVGIVPSRLALLVALTLMRKEFIRRDWARYSELMFHDDEKESVQTFDVIRERLAKQ